MRSGIRTVMAAAVAASLAGGVTAANVPWEERSAVERVWYTAGAVVANLTPVSALYAPRCLPGYLLCKLSFAGASVLAAADQLVFSGGGDLAQTRAILYRGFAGDWVLTPRHVAGEARPEPLPEPPPPGAGGEHRGFAAVGRGVRGHRKRAARRSRASTARGPGGISLLGGDLR